MGITFLERSIRDEAGSSNVKDAGSTWCGERTKSRDALRRARPDKAAYSKVLPLDGAHSIYTYTLASDPDQADCHLQSRMFTGFMAEDTACGSGTAAVSALQAELRGSDELALRFRQEVDMGRPTTLLTRVTRSEGTATVVRLGGSCVAAMDGMLLLPPAA
jgi:trans-2,3-dihydro-3-hydroxyanthranilate isomerase